MVAVHRREATIHFAGGTPVIHHGRDFTIMTNDAPYDEQLTLLAQQGFSHSGGDHVVDLTNRLYFLSCQRIRM